MTTNERFPDSDVLPEEAAQSRAAAALLLDRLPEIGPAVEHEIAQYGDDVGEHVIYGNTMPAHLDALATASPRDEAAVARASAFLEEMASASTPVPYLDNVAELSVIESILDKSIPASRLFIAERGGPATRRLAESCAKRWDLPLETLLDPEAPYHPDGSPVRSDPRWQRT